VPLRARLTAIFGALVLAPDTMLLRLTRFESSSEWLTSWGNVFYRAWGRLIFLPILYVLVHGKTGAYVDAVRALGARRLWLGAALYMVQNVAFIVAASMTYIASVLSIVATGALQQLFSERRESPDAHVVGVVRVRRLGAADIRRRPGERRGD
jgi:hypothetical protein